MVRKDLDHCEHNSKMWIKNNQERENEILVTRALVVGNIIIERSIHIPPIGGSPNMDLEMFSLYLWIAFTNALSAGIVGYVMYRLGRTNGIKMYNMAKKELKKDVSKFLTNQFNGILGPAAKKAKNKAKILFNEEIQKNPAAAQAAMSVTYDAIGAAAGEQFFGLEGGKAKKFGQGLKYFIGNQFKGAQGGPPGQIRPGQPQKGNTQNRIP